MATQPRLQISIIGAGNIGGTLTRRLTRLGHDVAVANSRGPSRSPALPPRPARPPSRSTKRRGAGTLSS